MRTRAGARSGLCQLFAEEQRFCQARLRLQPAREVFRTSGRVGFCLSDRCLEALNRRAKIAADQLEQSARGDEVRLPTSKAQRQRLDAFDDAFDACEVARLRVGLELDQDVHEKHGWCTRAQRKLVREPIEARGFFPIALLEPHDLA